MRPATILRLPPLHSRTVIDAGVSYDKSANTDFGLIRVGNRRLQCSSDKYCRTLLTEAEYGIRLVNALATDQVRHQPRLLGADPRAVMYIRKSHDRSSPINNTLSDDTLGTLSLGPCRVRSEHSCGRKLTQLMPHHIFRDKNLMEHFSVMHHERMPNKLRDDGAATRPRFHRLFAVLLIQTLHLQIELVINVGAFFQRS